MPRGEHLSAITRMCIAGHAKGHGAKAAAFKYGVSRRTVHNCCKYHGIRLRSGNTKPIKIRPHGGPQVKTFLVLLDLLNNARFCDLATKYDLTERQVRGIYLAAKAAGFKL